MLEELHVAGYALIDKLSISFADGLNVLSGETGAGKSILVGALSLLLGEKADASAVRAGVESAQVSGTISVEGSPEVLGWLEEKGIEPEDGQILLRRNVKSSGKGQIFIQSTPATRADLADLTAYIFDMHGQHQHQSLLKVDTHRQLIDRYGGHEELALQFNAAFKDLSDQKKELASLEQNERDRLREQDLLSFAVRDIDAADLKPGEEEELLREARVLSQSEKLFSLLRKFHQEVAEAAGGGLSGIRNGISDLKQISDIDPATEEYAKRLETAFYEMEDVSESVRQYQDGIDFSPERLEECEERLAVIRRLEKKYGADIEHVDL